MKPPDRELWPNQEQPRHVLCLDHEGSHGGSSRSLYFLIQCLTDTGVVPEVWCRREGPLCAAYETLGVTCRVVPLMPSASVVPFATRNLAIWARAAVSLWRARGFLDELTEEVNRRFNVVHFNHVGLWLVARYLRSRTKVPFVFHMRTKPVPGLFARVQTRVVSRVTDYAVFITENEEAHFRQLGGTSPGSVIYNAAPSLEDDCVPDTRLPGDRFKVASFGNFGWNRGLERLADVAAILVRRGRRDVLFVMAGTMALKGPLPGRLGELRRRGGTLSDYVADLGLAEMFLFLGHVNDPDSVYAGCDLVIKPARVPSPWGRDVIEGMTHGKPVIAIGTWDGFVSNGVTGYLQPDFDAESMADAILRLADDPELRLSMGRAARGRIRELCDGPARARDLCAVWRSVTRT